MKNTENIEIKNPSSKVLQLMKKLGMEKYVRQQGARAEWENGNYSETDVIRL